MIARRLAPFALAATLATPAVGQVSLFPWTLDVSAGGSGTLSEEVMQITGPDNGPPCSNGHTAKFEAVAPVAGVVLVNATLQNWDKGGPGYDLPVFLINGVETVLPSGFGYELGFSVPAGAAFGFGVHSLDCWAGPAILTIDVLRFYPSPTELRLEGNAGGDRFGESLEGVGDFDGDGVPDVAVGISESDAASLNAGRIEVRSGATGALLLGANGAAPSEHFGFDLSPAGDFDGDGRTELLVGAPRGDGASSQSGVARLISSVQGNVLLTFSGKATGDRFGSAVAGAGDITGDGVGDLLVGAPQEDSAGPDSGAVRLYSGATGALIRELFGVAGDRFGHALDRVGDVNGDGREDFLIGAPSTEAAKPGKAILYSGATGAPIAVFTGAAPQSMFGRAVSGAGDCDADGFSDVAIGAPNQNVPATWAGHGFVYSGAHGQPLLEVHGSVVGENLGHAVDTAQDFDGDGYDDVLFGSPSLFVSPYQTPGRAWIVSGRTGDVLAPAFGDELGDGFGLAVAGIGDWDGDGRGDVAIGAPSWNSQRGRVRLVSQPLTWVDLGVGLAGTAGTPTAIGAGLLTGGEPATLHLQDAVPNSFTTLFVGVSAVNLPLLGGTLVPDPMFLVGALPTGPTGRAQPAVQLARRNPARSRVPLPVLDRGSRRPVRGRGIERPARSHAVAARRLSCR